LQNNFEEPVENKEESKVFINPSENEHNESPFFLYPDPVPNFVPENQDSIEKMHAETPQFRENEKYNSQNIDDYEEIKREDQSEIMNDFQQDLDPKRSFGFFNKNIKRPPDLNIELIANQPSYQGPLFSTHNQNSDLQNPDSQKEKPNNLPLVSPISVNNLSPLNLPGHIISLANTPTMLNSFMNVLKKESDM